MGFKAEQFVKSVDENLFCSICHDVFEDPVSCKDGHTFCKDCIHKWLTTHRKCPLDNRSLTKRHLVHVLMAKGIIDNLEVYCQPCTQDKTNEVDDIFGKRVLRCDWVGKLQHLTHHRKTCPFQEVKCSHVKCSQTMQRRELVLHLEICDFRKMACDKCELLLYQRDKDKHMKDDCLMALISCPNQCKDEETKVTEIQRIDLKDHLSNICPKAQVNCPYKEQGCGVKVERQDVDKHVQENMAGHMMLLAKECSLLRKQNTSLTDQCSSLIHTNVELKNELKQIKEEFHNQISSCKSYTWTLSEYPNIFKNYPNGYLIRSPTFWLCGYKWHILLYPNGNSKDETGFLSLYLYQMNDSPTNTITHFSSNESSINFRMTVIRQSPGAGDVSCKGKSVFTKESNNRGWRKFMKASDALLTYCKNGRLMIQCTVEPDKIQ